MSKMNITNKDIILDEFLEKFMYNGFGSLPKREMEIYIFYLLKKNGAFNNMSNYDMANLLKISENRIKTLIADSSIKYECEDNEVFHKKALEEIANIFFNKYKNKIDLTDDIITISLENPVLQRELNYAIKKIGYFSDTSFNKEIIKIKATVFIAVFYHYIDDVRDKFEMLIKKQNVNDKEYNKIINKPKPISEKVEEFLDKNKNKIGFALNLLSGLSFIKQMI